MYKFIKGLRRLHRIGKSRNALLKFVASCSLNPDLVGEKLGEGGQHRIYHYGGDKVLKVLKFDYLGVIFGFHNIDDIQKEADIIKEYFPDSLLHIVVFRSKKFPHYCILQDKLENYDHLNKDHLKESLDDLKDILDKNHTMIKTKGCALDLFGRKGLIESYSNRFLGKKDFLVFYNLVWIHNERDIRIIDTNLLKVAPTTEKSIIKRLRFRYLLALQEYLLKSYTKNMIK